MQRRSLFATGLMRLVTFAVLPAAVSCVDAFSAVSDGPAPAGVKVAQLTDAVAARFTSPERSGRFETARRRLVSGALSPSRIYEDSSIWSVSIPPATKGLIAHGGLTDRGYRFEIAPERSTVLKVGDTRHAITVRKLSESDFRWNTNVDFAIGALTAADAGDMLMELLTGGHDRDGASVRSGAAASYPRSSAVLGRVFAIDSLTLNPGAQGTTTVSMTIGIRPDGLRASAPHFAEYITRYVARSRYRFLLTDRNGATYFDAVGGDQILRIRYRVRSGAIVSLLGPPRHLPDSLRLLSDLSVHVKVFDVGWKSLVTDFVIGRTNHSRSWTMTAQAEPHWQLPLITERLIRSPLRRPFQGDGASLELAVVDSAGGQTLLIRRAQLEIKESAIFRFLGGLVTRMFDDLDPQVEREEAAYIRELMLAVQQDARRAK